MLAEVAPLACGSENGAEDLERPVGAAGPFRAGGVELGGDARMIDGVEPELPEGGHQAGAFCLRAGATASPCPMPFA